MKPLILSIQAFGPFAGREQIDFTLLGATPLFLINGPTGSGKSSILDAICFALYGQTTGAEREAAQMRCDHADAETLTEVSLDFSLGAKQYRIRRVPLQNRPRLRGTGFTTHNTEAQLYALDAGAESRLMVSRSVTEATEAIKQLIGLDVEQFRQVMVLPQGKFRELLLADSKQREAIFGQLFQTSIYKRIEEQLKLQANSITQAVAEQRQRIQGVLDSAQLTQETEIASELTNLQPQLSAALQAKDAAAAQQLHANQVLEQAKQVEQRFATLAQKTSQLQALQALAPAINAQQNRLQLALSAQAMQAGYAQLQQKQQALSTLNAQISAGTQAVQVATAEHSQAEQQFATAKAAHAQVDGYKQQLQELQQYVERVNVWRHSQQQQQACLQAQQQSEQQYQASLTLQQEFGVELTGIETQCAQMQQDLARLPAQQHAWEISQQQLTQRQHLESHSAQLQQLMTAEQQGQEVVLAKQAAWLQRQTEARQTEWQWHNAQAALLAEQLQQDQPCPVCGSTQHPAPAQHSSSAARVSKVQVDKARAAEQAALQALQQAKEALEQAHTQVLLKQQTLADLQQQLQELAQQPIAELAARSRALEQAVQQLLALQQHYQSQSQRHAALKNQLNELHNSLTALQAQVEADRLAVHKVQFQREELEKNLPAAYRDATYLSTAMAECQQRIEQCTTQLQQAESNLEQKRSARDKALSALSVWQQQQLVLQPELAAAEQEWQQVLAQSPFSTLTAFQQAQLSTEQCAALRQEIERYSLDLAQLQGAVTQLQQDLAAQLPPDIGLLQQQLTAATAQFLACDEAWRLLQERVNQLQRTQTALQALQAQSSALEAQYKVFGTLSEVANGKTGNRVSLQRFVLSVLLDDVLIQASQRLLRMSQGRYQLVRKEERTGGNSASGLNLEVEDNYTGKTRAVATLSGGESFMAALSLALGLSDVVQSYAGGIKLDTLFIDEGFGSLDAEALDLAIRTLMELQASGRMIGIISHVSELKEQMALRIDLVSSKSGSYIAKPNAQRV